MAKLAEPKKNAPSASSQAAVKRKRVHGVNQPRQRGSVWTALKAFAGTTRPGQGVVLRRELEVSKPNDEQEREAEQAADEVLRKEEEASAGSSDAGENDEADASKEVSGVWRSRDRLENEPSNGEHARAASAGALQRKVEIPKQADEDEDRGEKRDEGSVIPATLRRETEAPNDEPAETEPSDEGALVNVTQRGATLQRASESPAREDEDERRRATALGLGGGCTSCGVQRQPDPNETDTTDAADAETNAGTLQPGLLVGKVDDSQEREADEAAERVMRMHDEDESAVASRGSEAKIRRTPDQHASDAPAPEEEEDEPDALREGGADPQQEGNAPRKRMRALTLGGHPVSHEVSNRIAELRRAGGVPLPRLVRREFEARFGDDFADVRIHTGEGPASVAKRLRAKAFTIGHDVVFGKGQLQPETAPGKRLIAHELTHVLQQRGHAGHVMQRLERSDDDGERAASTSMLDLLQLFGIVRGQLAPRTFTIIEELLSKALGRVDFAQSLRMLVAPSKALVRRSIESTRYRLLLEVEQGVELAYRWHLTDLLGKSIDKSTGSAAGVARGSTEGALDTQLLSVVTLAERQLTPKELTPDEGRSSEADTAAQAADTAAQAADTAAQAADTAAQAAGTAARPSTGPSQTLPADERVEPPVAIAAAPPTLSLVEEKAAEARTKAETAARAVIPKSTQAASPSATEAAIEAVPMAAEAAATVIASEAAPPEPEPSVAPAPALPGAATAAPAEPKDESVDPDAEADLIEAKMADAAIAAAPAPETAPDPSDAELEPAVIEPVTDEAAAPEAPLAPEETPTLDGVDAGATAPLEASPAPSVMQSDATSALESTAALENPERSTVASESPAAVEARLTQQQSSIDAVSRKTETDTAAEAPSEAQQQQDAEVAELGGEAAATPELPAAEQDAALSALAEGGTPEGAEGASGGGAGAPGGGATAKPPEAQPAPPDVASMKPTEALGAIARLPPVALQRSLTGVSTSVANDVSTRRDELAAAPPKLQRPTGAPMTKAEAPDPKLGAVPTGADPTKVTAAARGADLQTPAPNPLPQAPPAAIQNVARPPVTADAEGKVTADDAAKMRSRIASMPTSDPALAQTAGDAPVVALEGNASPAQMLQQHAELRSSLTEARVKGATQAAEPMGEQALFPDVPEEELVGKVATGKAGAGAASVVGGGAGKATAGPAASTAGAAAGGAATAGAADEVAISAIAKEERGGEIATAVGTAQSQMQSADAQHAQSVTEAEQTSTQQIADAETANADEQAAERQRAQSDVAGQRSEWTGAQQDEIRGADEEASRTVSSAANEVEQKRGEANEQATEEIRAGNEAAAKARQEGEKNAEQARAKGQQQSEGFFGWVAKEATAFFDSIKAGIKQALDAARALVKQAIEAAKKLAADLIEKARKWIVDKIKAAGDFLIALGDRVLAAFPALREKYRNAIKSLVAAAEDVINKLADGLKKVVTALLDAWGKLLDAALGLLEKGLMAAVDAVAATVKGAIDFAKKAVEALGAFAALISDIAADPKGWIRNLGAAVVSGIRDHLWTALKKAVKDWFNAKIEGLIGVGKVIWQVVTGQLGFAAIAKLAWAAILAMLPPTLIRILIEKLVAIIVPAAGALMAIVEGLQAAWGTIGAIISALEKFVAFLKAVKGGNAAMQFAEVLASAAVVVLDFVANFLIAKLGTGLKKLAGKLAGIAKRLMKRKRAAGGRTARRAKRKGKPGKGRRRGAPKPRRRGKSRPERGRGRGKPRRRSDADRRRELEAKKRERLNRAKAELPPKINALLSRGVNGLVLKGRLLVWRLQYRLTSLSVVGAGTSFRVVARVNPTVDVGHGVEMDARELLVFTRDLAKSLLESAGVEAEGITGSERVLNLPSGSTGSQVVIPSGATVPGIVRAMKELAPLKRGKVREMVLAGTDTRVRVRGGSTFKPSIKAQEIIEVSEGKLRTGVGSYSQHAERGIAGLPASMSESTKSRLLANALEVFQTEGKVPVGFDKDQIAALFVTMFGQEGARSDVAMLHGQMAQDLLAHGTPVRELLGADSSGGILPLSPRGVGTGAAALDEHLESFRKGTARPLKPGSPAEVQLKREVAFTLAWIKALDLKVDSTATAEQKKQQIKDQIAARLRAALVRK